MSTMALLPSFSYQQRYNSINLNASLENSQRVASDEITNSSRKRPKITQQQFLTRFSRGQHAFPTPRGMFKTTTLYSPSRYGGASWSYASSRDKMIGEFEQIKEQFLQLRTGQLYTFHGSELAHVSAELLSTWYYYKKFPAGIGKSALFIDGGNIFSPYLLADYARRLGLSPRTVLENVRASRAFTCHQLKTLVTEKVKVATLAYDAYLVIVTDAAFLFQDSEVKPREAYAIFDRMAACLKQLSRNLDIMVVVTTSSLPGSSRLSLEKHLHDYSDLTFEFQSTVKTDLKQTKLDIDFTPLLSPLKPILSS